MRDLRSRPREIFGPRQPGAWGGMLRFAQWTLGIITVVCIWPGAMFAFTVLLDGYGFIRDAATPPVSEMLRYGAWLTWAALVMMTGLRVSGQWYRRWAFMPVAAANAALLLFIVPDGAKDPLGMCLWQLMLGVTVAQCLMHGLWSLAQHRLTRKGR